MRPTLPAPTPDQLRGIASMRMSPHWPPFGEWLDEAYENAVKQTLSCPEEDLTAARSLAAALGSIRETFETAPDALRETAE